MRTTASHLRVAIAFASCAESGMWRTERVGDERVECTREPLDRSASRPCLLQLHGGTVSIRQTLRQNTRACWQRPRQHARGAVPRPRARRGFRSPLRLATATPCHAGLASKLGPGQVAERGRCREGHRRRRTDGKAQSGTPHAARLEAQVDSVSVMRVDATGQGVRHVVPFCNMF